jgi:hypothetical protein
MCLNVAVSCLAIAMIIGCWHRQVTFSLHYLCANPLYIGQRESLHLCQPARAHYVPIRVIYLMRFCSHTLAFL